LAKTINQPAMKRLLFGIPVLFSVTTLLAQTATPTDADAAAAVAGLAAGGVMCGVVWLVSIGLWLWAAIFVMKDAKRRNSPNATLVTVLTWIPATWFIGWLIHMITRPKTVNG
jgi:hypothetical protein